MLARVAAIDLVGSEGGQPIGYALAGPIAGTTAGAAGWHFHLAGYVTSGALRPVVNGVFPLADVAAAHRAFAQGGTPGKHVIAIAP